MKTAISIIAIACLCACLPTKAQTLYLHVYPSQDDPTKTLWIFGPNGNPTLAPATAHYGSSIRNINATNYHARDSWISTPTTQGVTNIFFNNKPTNQVLNLTPLFSSTNHPKDIESITKRLPGHGFGQFNTNNRVLFGHSNITNAPTMTAGSATKTIGGIFMNAAAQDEIGIRGTAGGGNLVYTNGQSTSWFGTGIMDKPIDDFLGGLPDHDDASFGKISAAAPYFVARGGQGVPIKFHRRVIPEPAEYALVFGLFALAFMIVRRRFQKR